MKPEIPQAFDATKPVKAAGWTTALLTLAVMLVLLAVAFGSTFESIEAIWARSETFAHGYLIAPISIWLIWQRKERLGQIEPHADWLPCLLLPALGFAWLLGSLAGVKIVQQYAAVAMIPLVVWAVLGRRVAAELTFPLAFLLLAVPVGEVFLLPLMNFTADFTVGALRLSGIPVYREGLTFMVPSGDWSVVEACSGLRYLIASFTLGLLYAYLTYRSLARRLAFVVLATGVPVLANGIRAYMIVMIGHLSGMKYAVGVDHLIYGWAFFGLVMLALYWTGARWRQDREPEAPVVQPEGSTLPWLAPARAGHLAVLAALVLAWPVAGRYLGQPVSGPLPVLRLQATPGWTLTSDKPDVAPDFQTPSTQITRLYKHGDSGVAIYLAYYGGREGDGELISSSNRAYPSEDKAWRLLQDTSRKTVLGPLREAELRSDRGRWLSWTYYLIDGEVTGNPYRAKWLQAASRLMGRHGRGAAVVLYAPYADETDPAVTTLNEFLRDMGPAVAQAVTDAGRP